MVAKAFFVLCASAVLVQSISGQCLGYGNGLGLGGNIAGSRLLGAELAGARLGGAGLGYGLAGPASASGGGLTVSSISPIAPTGVSVVSENAIEGPVEVGGQLPVLAAVALEGQVPTGGAAGTTYSCGNGNVVIASEIGAASAVNAASAGLGAAGIAGAGLLGAGINGANFAAANRLGRPCGAIY